MFSREMMEVEWGGCDGCNRAYQNIPSTPWASYQIRKIAGCACAGNTGSVFPATDFKGNRCMTGKTLPAFSEDAHNP